VISAICVTLCVMYHVLGVTVSLAGRGECAKSTLMTACNTGVGMELLVWTVSTTMSAGA